MILWKMMHYYIFIFVLSLHTIAFENRSEDILLLMIWFQKEFTWLSVSCQVCFWKITSAQLKLWQLQFIFFFSENLSFAPPKTIHQHLVILEKKRCSCSLPGPVDGWDLSQPIFFLNGFSIYRFVIKSVNCNSLAPFFMKKLCTFKFRSNQL